MNKRARHSSVTPFNNLSIHLENHAGHEQKYGAIAHSASHGILTWSDQATLEASRLSNRVWLRLLDEQRIAREIAVAKKMQLFWRKSKTNFLSLAGAAARASSSTVIKEETEETIDKKLHKLEEDLTSTFGPQIVARSVM